jgi:hypothetical protein
LSILYPAELLNVTEFINSFASESAKSEVVRLSMIADKNQNTFNFCRLRVNFKLFGSYNFELDRVKMFQIEFLDLNRMLTLSDDVLLKMFQLLNAYVETPKLEKIKIGFDYNSKLDIIYIYKMGKNIVHKIKIT